MVWGTTVEQFSPLWGPQLSKFLPVELNLPVRPPVEINLNWKAPKFQLNGPVRPPPLCLREDIKDSRRFLDLMKKKSSVFEISQTVHSSLIALPCLALRCDSIALRCVALRCIWVRVASESGVWVCVGRHGGRRARRAQHYPRWAVPACHQRLAFARGTGHVRRHVVLGFVQSEARRCSANGMASSLGGSWTRRA